METINILIADDHQIIRNGLKSLIKEFKDFKVIAEAENGEEVIKKVNENSEISLILLDINMPNLNGIETATILKKTHPHIKTLVLSIHDDEEYISKMLQAGASGYILKKTEKKELATAIRTVAEGNSYFSQEVSSLLLDKYLNKSENHERQIIQKEFLTKRELEILKLIGSELTTQEIADKLFISFRTVETHRRNLLIKLDVRNTAGLIKHASKLGLL